MSLERDGLNLLSWFHYYAKTKPQYAFKNGTVENLLAYYTKGSAAKRKIYLEGIGDVYAQLVSAKTLFSPPAQDHFKEAYRLMAEKGDGLIPDTFTAFQTTPGLVASKTPWTDRTVKFLKPLAAVGDAALAVGQTGVAVVESAAKTAEIAAKGITWGARVLVPLAIAGAAYFYFTQVKNVRSLLKRGS